MRDYTDWMIDTCTEAEWAATAAQDGELQAVIDHAEALQAAEDAMIDALFAALNEEPVDFDLFDYEAEAEDYEDYMADVEFFRHGC